MIKFRSTTLDYFSHERGDMTAVLCCATVQSRPRFLLLSLLSIQATVALL